jgi:acetylornithine/succinyldiaminopimelate/putrescine aminotransferase
MSALAKLTVKTVTRTNKQDPVQQRRQKLMAGIEEQLKVAAAAVKGESYEVRRNTWAKNEQGEKVLVERMRKVRAWFFEQDGGWYVQCKYGSKALALGKGNAVFVKALKEVEGALVALKAAAEAGELDEAITDVVRFRKKPMEQ